MYIKFLNLTHIIFLLLSVLFIVLSCLIIRKLNRKTQNIIFIIISILGSLGIFIRYTLIVTNYKFNISLFLIELLQVCNFNCIILPLMLFKKNEFIRQLSFYFFMPSACTVFFSLPSICDYLPYYSLNILNFWFNHLLSVLLPLLMYSCNRLRPNKKYIIPCILFVTIYFLISYLIQLILINNNLWTIQESLSFVFRSEGVGLFDYFYSIISHPFIYLLPALPILLLFFFIFYLIFKGDKKNGFY